MRGKREYPAYIVPHSDHGDPECCGLIMIETEGGTARLVCNECGATFLRPTSPASAERKLQKMEAEQPSCSARCPHCGHLNEFTGMDKILLYTCESCGASVQVPDQPPDGGGEAKRRHGGSVIRRSAARRRQA